MSKVIFEHLDYRASLQNYFKAKGKAGAHLSNTKLAEVFGVHKAFLTKVFNHDAHLSSDHLYLLFENFKFSEDETRYLHIAYEYARTGLAKRKRALLSELRELQRRQTHIEKNVDIPFTDVTENNPLSEYYLDPNFLLVHSFLNIEKYARDPEKICRHLSFNKNKLQHYLTRLMEMKIIAKDGKDDRFRVLNERMHLKDTSPLWTASSNIMRVTCAERVRQMDRDAKMDISVILSISEEAHLNIRRELLKTFEKCQTLVKESKSEQVYQLTLTMFPWELD